jgi:hypothetical protein
MVGKGQKSHGARSGLYGGCSNDVPQIHFFQVEHRIQFRSRPMRFLGFEIFSFENLHLGHTASELTPNNVGNLKGILRSSFT